MGTQGESFMKKTQKGLSILAFETTKQSRILKKRMRAAALQKEIKADLRDLGNLVYNALINDQAGILEEEEVKILSENIRDNKAEVEHLRDAMARLTRSRKHFEEEEFSFEAPAEAPPPPATEEKPVAEEKPAAKRPAAKRAAPKKKAAQASTPDDATAPLLEPEAEKQPAKPRAKRPPRKPAASKAKKPTAEKDDAKPAAKPSAEEPGK